MCDVPAHFGKFNEVTPERGIYSSLVQFLPFHGSEHFRPKHGIVEIFAEDISQIPAQQAGMWTRPDVAAVSLRRARFARTKELDLISFEVKTFRGTDIASVHQALAQAQFVNRSYLVWNRPFCTCGDSNYSAIEQSCRKYGVGLLTVHDPSNLQTFEFRISPQRNELTPDELDEFIVTRFSQSAKQMIEAAIRQP